MNKPSSYQFHYLLHSADLIKEYLQQKLMPFGISPHQARVIKALDIKGPVSQVTLAREFNITAASMSTMTSRLTSLGFINCEKDTANGKRNLVSLSTKGIEVLDDISEAWKGVDTYMEEKIGANDMAALSDLTKKLRDSLGGTKPDLKDKQ